MCNFPSGEWFDGLAAVARADGEVDAGEQRPPPVADGHPLQPDERHGHRRA